MKKRTSRAYTLAELIVVVMLLGIMSAISIPRMNFATIRKNKASTAVQKIVASLRRTRVLAISDAAENSGGYELKMTGGAPFNGYEIEKMKNSVIVDSHTFDPEIAVTNGKEFKFGPLGSLVSGDTEIDVAAEGRSYTITIVSATGMVKWVQN